MIDQPIIHLQTPLTDDVIDDLHIGVQILLSGVIYTARDAAHKRELLDLVNATGIGPQSWVGVNTALDVRVDYYPTHIAAIPICVNLDCHFQRHPMIEC